MRDYRDAKAMAQTLREGLRSSSVNITHSAALELIAKVLGFKDWHVLAARIETERPAVRAAAPPAAPSTVYCSFCGKSQHEVAKLIAGPSVFICDECIDLCDDIVADRAPEFYLEGQQALASKSTEDLVVLKAKARSSAARARQILNLLSALDSDAGASPPGEQPNPQRQFILRKTPQERATYRAEVERQMAGVERVSEAVASLLAMRGVSLEAAVHRPG